MRALFIAAILLSLTSGTLNAEGTRYSTWSDPTSNTGTATMQDFIARLNKMIDEAEKSKAADPLFLRDLRALASGQTSPWNATLLDDGFADGNYTANPAWQVLSGEYFIESGWGLRNRLIQAQPAQTSSTNSGDDFAKVLLGQILKRATNTQTGTATATENIIVTRAKISNAFALEMEMSSWISENHFEVGVFQGDQAQIGYRLLYVSVDGKELISTSDRAFSDPFDGVRISDKGGDYIIKHITVKGL